MHLTVSSWGFKVFFPAAALALLVPAGQVQAQRGPQQGGLALQQGVFGQHNGQNQGFQVRGQAQQTQNAQSLQQQLTALKTALENALQQLNTLLQSGTLTAGQVKPATQLQTALQNALKQVNAALQSGTLTSAQFQTLRQQQNAATLQVQALQPRLRR
jgi:hypothetical protein